MAVTKFMAKHATLAYGSGAVTWDAATALDGETLTANVASVKDLTVSVPEQGVEQVACLGNVAQTIGANARTAGTATGVQAGVWQCQALIATSVSNWKVEGTLVLTGDEQIMDVLGLGTSVATGGGSDTRYAVGTLTSGAFTKNQLGTIRVFWNNSTETMSVALTNTWVVKVGDIKPTGADGHFEVSFSAECLPKDGAIEWAD